MTAGNQNQPELIILYPYGAKHLGLFDDLKNNPHVYLRYSERKFIRFPGLSFLRRLHFSLKLNRIFPLPGKHLWYGFSDIFSLLKKTRHILIIDTALRSLDENMLQKLKARNAILDLYLINSMNAKSPRFLEIKSKLSLNVWHRIYTFDPVDAQKYGYTFRGFDYYTKHPVTIPENSESDAYFIGGIKGNRENLVNHLYKAISTHGGKCDFHIMVYKNQKYTEIEGIHYIQGNWQPYSNVLNALVKSNVIVEILQEGQYGASLRYFEAVCYDKKLLTNNPHITSFPFYNERYMKIFHDINDIDYEWLCKREPVKYNYQGEFSPLQLFKHLSSEEALI